MEFHSQNRNNMFLQVAGLRFVIKKAPNFIGALMFKF